MSISGYVRWPCLHPVPLKPILAHPHHHLVLLLGSPLFHALPIDTVRATHRSSPVRKLSAHTVSCSDWCPMERRYRHGVTWSFVVTWRWSKRLCGDRQQYGELRENFTRKLDVSGHKYKGHRHIPHDTSRLRSRSCLAVSSIARSCSYALRSLTYLSKDPRHPARCGGCCFYQAQPEVRREPSWSCLHRPWSPEFGQADG
ncbi:hypothetical protein BKA93DRAFT_232532 [Sparassis latifolia]